MSRRGGVVVEASASQPVDEEFIAFLLRAQHERNSVENSRQICVLCLWSRHFTGCIHFYVAKALWGKAGNSSR